MGDGNLLHAVSLYRIRISCKSYSGGHCLHKCLVVCIVNTARAGQIADSQESTSLLDVTRGIINFYISINRRTELKS